MQRSLATLAISGALAALVPGTLAAQGFSVNEHGSCSMARGGTGVASACADGSAVNFNPSGIAGTTGMTLGLGVTAIQALGSFTDDYSGVEDDLQNDPIPVPHAYFVYSVNEKLAAGFGFFVPYGLGTVWETTFEGRFNGYDNNLQSMYFQPTLAYQPLKGIRIGAGFDFVLASLKLTQRVDLSEQPAPAPAPAGTTLAQLGVAFHTDFANAALEAGGATGFGGNFGITLQPTDWFSLGARYLTRVALDYEGTADFEAVSTGIILPGNNPIGMPAGTPLDALVAASHAFDPDSTLGDQAVTTSITMPDQATAGIAIDVSPSLMLLADWQWMNWSVFDVLSITFENQDEPKEVRENYKDTHAIRVGFDWSGGGKLSLRGGYLYHKGAAPPQTVTPLLPEGERNEFTGGIGYRITEQLTLDAAYQYIKQNDRRGRVREPLGGAAPTVALNSGLYKFYAHLVGVTLSVHF